MAKALQRVGHCCRSSSTHGALAKGGGVREGFLTHPVRHAAPPQTPDKALSSALVLWADLDQPPNGLAPDARDFLRAALTKDPAARPAAVQLALHPWIRRCESGEPYRWAGAQDAPACALNARQRLWPLSWARILGVPLGFDSGGTAPPARPPH